MGYLRILLDKLDLNEEDNFTTACLKGMAEGVLDGLIIVGAMAIVDIAIDAIKK